MSERDDECVEKTLQAAEETCRQRGVRLTEIRREVLRLIARQGGGIKAYDLLAQLQQALQNAKPPTVYRALDFLLANGLIHRIESQNAFFSCDHPHHSHRFRPLVQLLLKPNSPARVIRSENSLYALFR